jgi:hypothetical protein
MPDEKTNADALRLYLTGALSVDAAQPYHSLSLGGLQSSTELGLGHDLTNPIAGLIIEYVSQPNGIGSGALAVISASEIAWTPPGGTQGAVVTIANGETQNIEGATASQYVRVTRTSATALSGTATVITHRCLGTAIVGRDATVDGLTTYSGMIFKNESAGEITNLEVWIAADTETRAWIATEAVTSDAITDISVQGDEQAPAGVSGWTQGTTSGAGLSLGTLAAGASVGLWMRRVVPGASDATPAQIQTVGYDFDWDGDTYTGGASGFYRVSDDDLQLYLLYRGVDTEPDLDAAPWETFIDTDPTEPSGTNINYDTAALDPSHTYFFVLRRQSKYELEGQNIYGPPETIAAWNVELDAGGLVVYVPPSAPEETTLTPIADGAVNVSAYYQSAPDGDDAADSWLIYLTSDGSIPDPYADTPVVVAMTFSGGLARLNYDSAEFADGTTVNVIIGTRRTGEADSEIKLGPDLVVNGGFDVGTDWTLGGSWAIGAGVLSATANGVNQFFSQDFEYVVGDYYLWQYEIVTNTLAPGTGRMLTKSSTSMTGGSSEPMPSAVGEQYFFIQANNASTSTALRLYLSSEQASGDLSVDNISVKRITDMLSTTTSTESDTEILPGSCWVIERGKTITRVWEHDANNYIDLILQTGVFRFVVDGSIVAGINSGGFLARDGITISTPALANVAQTDLIEIDGSGRLSFAGEVLGSKYSMMTIDSGGVLRVSSVVVEGAYPFAEVNVENISWDDPNVDFSGDLLNVIMRITQVDIGGFVNGVLHTKGVVDL